MTSMCGVRTLPITGVAVFGVGGLIAFAVGLAIFLGVGSARRNTEALLSDFIETGQLITAGHNRVGRYIFL